MYTTKEAAKALSVRPQTIHRYTKLAENPLRTIKRNLRGDFLIREDELIEFARAHELALELPRQPA